MDSVGSMGIGRPKKCKPCACYNLSHWGCRTRRGWTSRASDRLLWADPCHRVLERLRPFLEWCGRYMSRFAAYQHRPQCLADMPEGTWRRRRRAAASVAGVTQLVISLNALCDSVLAHLMHAAFTSLMTPMQLQRCDFYTPCSLEIFVGQKVELCPLVSHPPSFSFAVDPQLPSGAVLDERSGLVHGCPQEPTPGQVKHYVYACNPARCPMRARVAVIKLTVIGAW